jgi:hypothetical protein
VNRLKAFGLVLAGAAGGALAFHAVTLVSAPDAGNAVAEQAEPADAQGLHLDEAAQRRAGIRLAALAAVTGRGEESGYARALDLSPLAAIAADVMTARTAASASGREAARLRALAMQDDAASRKDLETAEAQAAADRARLTLACQRIALEYGPGLARLGCDAVAPLAREAALGQAALLRIDLPAGRPATGSSIAVDMGGRMVTVTLLGPAAAGDTQLQTVGMLALLRGPAAAGAGTGRIMAARLPTAIGHAGVLVPREAIVRTDGALFAYRARGADGFERVPLTGAVAQEGGWFLPAGALHPGDRIAIAGAGTLLGLEHAAPAAADD